MSEPGYLLEVESTSETQLVETDDPDTVNTVEVVVVI